MLRRLVVAAISLGTLGLAIVWLITWAGVWPLTLFDHFRVQYVEIGALLVAGTAALRIRGYFDIALISTLLHALWIAPDLTASPRSAPAGGHPLRVLSLNVHTESTTYARVRELIADEQPDVIGLVEVNRRWLDELAPALTSYTGRIEEPRPDNFGIALYVRGDVKGMATELGSELPSIVADAAIGDVRLTVIVTHPLPPMNGAALAQQITQLDAVADRAASSEPPVIVMGDFNATPWSRPFRRALGRSGLCDSRAGFGVQPSFPAASALMRIPIDHVLVSCSIGVADRHIGRDVGSDHLPVIVDLVLRRDAVPGR